MQRIPIKPRGNLSDRARETGFELLTVDGSVYWDESAYYAFSLAQIEDDIEGPTKELAELCLALVDRAVGDQQILERLRIPPHAWDLIAQSWRRGEKALYGRFDLAYDGNGAARLLEYNADTPTALFEASVFQWLWLEDALAANTIPAGCDQFNSLHEKLIARFTEIAGAAGAPGRLHLACMTDSAEDRGLISYLEDCARQAGLATKPLAIGDIGSTGQGPFVDLENEPIDLHLQALSVGMGVCATPSAGPRPWPPRASSSRRGRRSFPTRASCRCCGRWRRGTPTCCRPTSRTTRPARGCRAATRGSRSTRARAQNVSLVDGGRVVDRDGGLYGDNGFIVQQLARDARLRRQLSGDRQLGDRRGARRHRPTRGHQPDHKEYLALRAPRHRAVRGGS